MTSPTSTAIRAAATTAVTTSSSAPLTWRRLLVLDFDDTIVAQNSDLVARDLLDPAAITDEHRRLYTERGWTSYMQAIFCTLHAHRFRCADVRRAVRAIPEVPGMRALIATLVRQHRFDAIIISDANTEFIEQWLEANALRDVVLQVFSNPAAYDEGGMLRIRPYHHQTECALSTENLCKGRVLEEFLREQQQRQCGGADRPPVAYGQIFYVGDGRNDVCPALRLAGGVDFACARRGFRMEKELLARKTAAVAAAAAAAKGGEQERAEGGVLQAGVISWTEGVELLAAIVANLRADVQPKWWGGCAMETRKEAVAFAPGAED